MATMNVSLPDPMKTWVEGRTKDGRYSNASDYVRDLIRRDQDRVTKIAAMQRLIDEGMQSGEAQPFDLKDFLSEMREKHGSAES